MTATTAAPTRLETRDPSVLARVALPRALVLRARGAAVRELCRRERDLLLVPLEPLTLVMDGDDGVPRRRRLRAYSLSWLPASFAGRLAADARAELVVLLVASGAGPYGGRASATVERAPLLDVTHADVGLLGTALDRLLTRPVDASETFLPPVVDWLLARCVRERERAARARPGASPDGSDAAWLKDVLDRIEERFPGPVSVAELARAFGMGESRFSRRFKALMGVPPSRYVRERRVTLAQRLLEATEQPLVDIAFEAGFCSQSHMTALFVRQLGVTPAQYRRLLDGGDAAPLSDVA